MEIATSDLLASAYSFYFYKNKGRERETETEKYKIEKFIYRYIAGVYYAPFCPV